MKLYTYYTDSHKDLYENYFLKSFKESKNSEDFDLDVTVKEQVCDNGLYYAKGWKETTGNKLDIFIRAVEENEDGIFLFSDVDVQFFDKISDILLEELSDFDIACQDDYVGGYCSGFFVARGNERVKKMFQYMKLYYHSFAEDQAALNACISLVKAKKLSKRFLTIGNVLCKNWEGEVFFNIPKETLVHHANWTVGVENKAKLLNLVKEKINS